jgi:hypothetical protein
VIGGWINVRPERKRYAEDVIRQVVVQGGGGYVPSGPLIANTFLAVK